MIRLVVTLEVDEETIAAAVDEFACSNKVGTIVRMKGEIQS